MQDVTVLLARTWQIWPGPSPSVRFVTREEESRLIDEFQAKAREISVDWEQFERIPEQDPLWLKNAALVRRSGSQVLSGFGHGEKSDVYFAFEVTGRAVRCERSDVGEISLDSLLRAGRAYWDAFASRELNSDGSKRSGGHA